MPASESRWVYGVKAWKFPVRICVLVYDLSSWEVFVVQWMCHEICVWWSYQWWASIRWNFENAVCRLISIDLLFIYKNKQKICRWSQASTATRWLFLISPQPQTVNELLIQWPAFDHRGQTSEKQQVVNKCLCVHSSSVFKKSETSGMKSTLIRHNEALRIQIGLIKLSRCYSFTFTMKS